ncbi:unnamed protein product [Calypogeia fissa]
MAAISSKRCSLMGAWALAVCVLAQVSFSAAEFELEKLLATPPLSEATLPKLPTELPQFSLPPLSSSLAQLTQTLSLSPQKVPFPQFSPRTILPPLPALRFPGFSYPPSPAKRMTPELNSLNGVTGFTFPPLSLPPAGFPLPRRAFPKSKLFKFPDISDITKPGFSTPQFSVPPISFPLQIDADVTIPGFTLPPLSVPPARKPLPRLAFPKSQLEQIKH